MNVSLIRIGILFLAAVLISASFSGCNDSSNVSNLISPPAVETTTPPTTLSIEEQIWGRWMVIENSLQNYGEGKKTTETQELHHFRTLDFFNDSTYVSNQTNYSGTYSVSGDRILLEGILVETLTYTFTIDGDILTLFAGENNHRSMAFARVK